MNVASPTPCTTYSFIIIIGMLQTYEEATRLLNEIERLRNRLEKESSKSSLVWKKLNDSYHEDVKVLYVLYQESVVNLRDRDNFSITGECTSPIYICYLEVTVFYYRSLRGRGTPRLACPGCSMRLTA